MAKFAVHFVKREHWSDEQFAKVEPQTKMDLSKYDKVALVEAENLEKVFESTNHIHDDWRKNENIAMVDNKEHIRSMCVGDLVVIPETDLGWRCNSIGWVEIRV